jgi:hypothetical protein
MRTSDFHLDSQGSKPSGSSEAFLHLIDKQNLGVIVNALKKLESAWAGAGVMLYVLQKRAAGKQFLCLDTALPSDHSVL